MLYRLDRREVIDLVRFGNLVIFLEKNVAIILDDLCPLGILLVQHCSNAGRISGIAPSGPLRTSLGSVGLLIRMCNLPFLLVVPQQDQIHAGNTIL